MRQHRKEYMTKVCIWSLIILCGGYICWEINPLPIQRGAKQIRQCAEKTVTDAIWKIAEGTLPVIGAFTKQEQEEITLTSDPAYEMYLSAGQKGDG